MTRYVLLSEFFPPDQGGIQASLGPIAEAFGDTLTVVAPRVTADNGRIRRSLFSSRHWPHWWWLVSWLRTARREGMELAMFGHFSGAVLAAVLARVPFALFISGNDLFFEQRRMTRWFIQPVLRRAKWIGVDSSFVRDAVQRYGISWAKIFFSHPFVPHSRVRQTVRSASAGHHFVTISRLVERKNILAVLDAFALVRKDVPDLQLDIVGDGPLRDAIVEHIAELQASDYLRLHGAVDEEMKWRLLNEADALVMVPTVERAGTDVEGFGLVYLEANACGLPVIAGRSGGIQDAVTDGYNGLLADPDSQSIAEAIRKLLSDQNAMRRLGENGRQRVLTEFTDLVRIPRTLLMAGAQRASKRLSVIIPVYQSANTIAQTLASLFSQTRLPDEVIIVDDGSTDNLADVLQPWRDRITFITQPNSGAPRARNRGFAASSGELVIFVDADCVLEPALLSVMEEQLLLHPEVAFVYSDLRFGWKHFHLREFSADALRRMNYIHTTSLMRREAFPGFDESLRRFQDWDLWLTMAQRGQSGMWIPQTLLTVQTKRQGLGMSTWLPSFVYRLPWIGRGFGSPVVAKYRAAEDVIRKKHAL